MSLQSFRPNKGLAPCRLPTNPSWQIGSRQVCLFPFRNYSSINSTFPRNPENYFAEVEQVAFSPLNLIPGIEPSPDRILQGRLFIYADTQSHRLGSNFNLLPTNKPRCPFRNYHSDGLMRCDDNNGSLVFLT